MQISLNSFTQLRDDPLALRAYLPLPELNAEIRSLVRMKPIDIQVEIKQSGFHRYRLQVQQSTVATFICSRCLEEFDTPMEASWTELFTDLPVADKEAAEIHPIGDSLRLEPWIREAFILQIPFSPVCREKCRGLCPNCGINRNEGICQCNTELIDPRLVKLQEFDLDS